jgi:hypothetical protein
MSLIPDLTREIISSYLPTGAEELEYRDFAKTTIPTRLLVQVPYALWGEYQPMPEAVRSLYLDFCEAVGEVPSVDLEPDSSLMRKDDPRSYRDKVHACTVKILEILARDVLSDSWVRSAYVKAIDVADSMGEWMLIVRDWTRVQYRRLPTKQLWNTKPPFWLQEVMRRDWTQRLRYSLKHKVLDQSPDLLARALRFARQEQVTDRQKRRRSEAIEAYLKNKVAVRAQGLSRPLPLC